jgi:hypothetical protein
MLHYFLLLATTAEVGTALLEVHVDATGQHTGSYRSLEEARDYLRSHRRGSEETTPTVTIHPGRYPPFHLDPKLDSFTSYRGMPGASLSGGVQIPREAFSAVGEKSPLVRADLFANGLSAEDLGVMMNGGSVSGCQHDKTDLLFGGERQTLARWPNVAANGSWQFANIDAVTSEGALQVNATAQPDAAARILSAWASEQDPWLHGYWTYDWTDSYVGIANITAASNGAARMALEPFIPVNPDARFYGVNLLCELDAPGEYFINNANGTLYFYPPVPLDDWGNSETVELTVNTTAVLDLKGTTSVSVVGLVVEAGRGTCLDATATTAAALSNLTVRNCGTTGVEIEGTGYVLEGSTVTSTGCVGIEASGGDVESLAPGGNLVDGNVVTKFALWKRTYQAGLLWGGVANTFRGNSLSGGPHNCALGGGNQIPSARCIWEDNDIFDCAYEASDTGAFYTCGQSGAWVNQGNVGRGNRFSNIRCRIHGRSVEGCGGGAGAVQAVYLDDQMSGWLWENNSFSDSDTCFFVGGGRSNVARGNTFEGCDLAVHVDDRGLSWEATQCAANGSSYADVEAVLSGPAADVWAASYPDVVAIQELDHLCTPVYNQIIDNTYKDCGAFIDQTQETLDTWLDVVSGNVDESEAAASLL